MGAMFLWFLKDLNKRQQRREELRDTSFIKAINATTSAVTKGMDEVVKKVDRVDEKVDRIHNDHQEDKEIIKEMYEHAVKAYTQRKRTVKVAVTQ